MFFAAVDVSTTFLETAVCSKDETVDSSAHLDWDVKKCWEGRRRAGCLHIGNNGGLLDID